MAAHSSGVKYAIRPLRAPVPGLDRPTDRLTYQSVEWVSRSSTQREISLRRLASSLFVPSSTYAFGPLAMSYDYDTSSHPADALTCCGVRDRNVSVVFVSSSGIPGVRDSTSPINRISPLVFQFTGSFAWFYTKRYASTTQKSWLSFATVVSGLAFSLLTTLLIPVDVFFASYAKLPNGTFAEWARNSSLLQDVEDTMEDTYFGEFEDQTPRYIV